MAPANRLFVTGGQLKAAASRVCVPCVLRCVARDEFIMTSDHPHPHHLPAQPPVNSMPARKTIALYRLCLAVCCAAPLMLTGGGGLGVKLEPPQFYTDLSVISISKYLGGKATGVTGQIL